MLGGSTRHVVISKEGSYGVMAEGEYEDLIEILVRKIENTKGINLSVKIVDSIEEEAVNIKAGRVDVVIFKTRGVIEKAKIVNQWASNLRVIVLTADYPDEEIVIIDKRWETALKTLSDAIKF